MIKYAQISDLPEEYIKSKIADFFAEDIPEVDYTTIGTVPEDKITTAYIESQEELIFAGEVVIPHFFDEKYEVKIHFKDGEVVPKNSRIAEIKGNARNLLVIERTLLNLLQRLCGIASMTKTYTKKVGGRIKVLDTRKTIPGLRLFDKYAVHCGGGNNHRLDLSSGVLIKDNHIFAAGGIKNALEQVKNINKIIPIELEVENFEQIKTAMDIGLDGFLLDNMLPEKCKKAVELIRSYPNGKDMFIEASGGITIDTIEDYSYTGVDATSIGALTHSVKSAEMHIEFEDF